MTVVKGVAYIDPWAAATAWDANSAKPAQVKPGPEHDREIRNDGQALENFTLPKVHIKN